MYNSFLHQRRDVRNNQNNQNENKHKNRKKVKPTELSSWINILCKFSIQWKYFLPQYHIYVCVCVQRRRRSRYIALKITDTFLNLFTLKCYFGINSWRLKSFTIRSSSLSLSFPNKQQHSKPKCNKLYTHTPIQHYVTK